MLSAAPLLLDPSWPGAPSRGHRSGLPAEAIASLCRLPKAVTLVVSGTLTDHLVHSQPQTRQCAYPTPLRGQRPRCLPWVPRWSPASEEPLLGPPTPELLRFHHPQPEDRAGGWGPRGARSRQGHCMMQRPGSLLEPRTCHCAPWRDRASSLGLGAKATPVVLPAFRRLDSLGPCFFTCNNRHSPQPPEGHRRGSVLTLCALGAASSPGAHAGPSCSGVQQVGAPSCPGLTGSLPGTVWWVQWVGGLDLIWRSLPSTIQWVRGVWDLIEGSLPGTIRRVQWVGGLDLIRESLPRTIQWVRGLWT